MKKIFLGITIFSIILSAICTANAEIKSLPPEVQAMFFDRASEQAKIYRPTWEKLYTCSVAKTGDGALIINGKDQYGNCRFRQSKYTCAVPMKLVKQYASAGLKGLDDIANGNFATRTDENDFMDKIHNEYCTVKQ